MTSYGEAGLHIPLAAAQQTIGAEVPSIDQLLPGDLVVVWSGYVVMVIGDGQMVEARHPVQISTIRTTNAGQSFVGFYPADRLAHPSPTTPNGDAGASLVLIQRRAPQPSTEVASLRCQIQPAQPSLRRPRTKTTTGIRSTRRR
jgi:hypothetical protein